LVGRRRVRKGIVFIAALEGVLLLLVVGGISLLPDGVEHAESGVDCADPVEGLEVPAGFIPPPHPEIDTRGALSDGLIGVLTSIPPTEPSSEPPRTCVFEATIEDHEPRGRLIFPGSVTFDRFRCGHGVGLAQKRAGSVPLERSI
jgi:hypothetical protein